MSEGSSRAKTASSRPSGERRAIRDAVRQLALLEAGYKCANPVCRHILTLELHHIVWVKDEGTNEPENLLALCPNCHSLHTAGRIPVGAIRTWKSLLVSLNTSSRTAADLLLVLFEEETRLLKEPSELSAPPFRFTGDGLPALSGLIVSGLVMISRRYSGASFSGGGMPSFEVRLTERGRLLVEAWISGKMEATKQALAGEA